MYWLVRLLAGLTVCGSIFEHCTMLYKLKYNCEERHRLKCDLLWKEFTSRNSGKRIHPFCNAWETHFTVGLGNAAVFFCYALLNRAHLRE